MQCWILLRYFEIPVIRQTYYRDYKKGENLMRKLLKSMSLFIFAALLVNLIPMLKVHAAVRETESNNTLESATNINVNILFTGNIADKYDNDYYKVAVPSDGEISLNFSHEEIPGDSQAHWTITLLDSKNNNYISFNIRGDEAQFSKKRGLPKGTYYVKVEEYFVGFPYNDHYYNTMDYNISVGLKSSSYYEKEFNDSMVSANPIQLNGRYTGAISSQSDTDYYKVIVTNDGEVAINFNHQEIPGDSQAHWIVSLLDSKSNQYISFDVHGNESQISRKRGLPKGTYYVKVEEYFVGFPYNDHYYNSMDYNISVTLKSGNYYEKEFNDSMVSANLIQLNSTYTGAINKNNDSDYYKFTVGSAGNTLIKFTHNKISGDSLTYWSIKVLDAQNKEYCNVEAIGNSDKIEKTINLPKGTYYLSVKPYYYNNMDYKVLVYRPVKVTSIRLNKTSLSLEKGKTSTLIATVGASNATNKAVSWKSSNTRIAIVDSKGKVTAIAPGTATITCAAQDGSKISAAAKVTVINPVTVTNIKLSKPSLSIAKGKTASLTATVTPSNAGNKTVVWRSENEKIAKVDANGKITAVEKGTTHIYCMTRDGNFRITSCKVTVTK
jgi:uncharacterized protein YjdB